MLHAPQYPYTRALLAAVPRLVPPVARPASTAPMILQASQVVKTYGARSLFGGRVTRALDGVGVNLRRGETLGLVGESGSGKSTLARAITRLMAVDGGEILLSGRDIAGLGRRELRPIRKRVPDGVPGPVRLSRPAAARGGYHRRGPDHHGTAPAKAREEASALLDLVGLDPAAANRFPHEFSGGQRQRIGIARALALRPEILVADEPVSALDVSVQARVLALLADIKARFDLSMVFVTHDLRVALQVCDRIAVMRHGRIVEVASTADIFHAPGHPIPKRCSPPCRAHTGRRRSKHDDGMADGERLVLAGRLRRGEGGCDPQRPDRVGATRGAECRPRQHGSCIPAATGRSTPTWRGWSGRRASSIRHGGASWRWTCSPTPSPPGLRRRRTIRICDRGRQRASATPVGDGAVRRGHTRGGVWILDGGLQAYHWAALYPAMVQRAIVVCGSARTATHNKVFLSGLLRTLEAAPEHTGHGRFSAEPKAALRAFGHIYAGWGLSQDFYRPACTAPPSARRIWRRSCAPTGPIALPAAGPRTSMRRHLAWYHADIADNALYDRDFPRALAAIQARVLLLPSEDGSVFPGGRQCGGT